MGDVLILCYHGISDRWPAPAAIPAARLEAGLRHLLARGYRGVTFSEAVLSPPRGRIVAVTFDDAYRSIARQAYPILSQLGLPGTLFVPTAWVDRTAPIAWSGMVKYVGGPHEHELEPMSWADVDELARAGWEIGSHTRSHPDLTALDDASLEDELEGSRADCEQRLGRPCRSIAYPYGRFDGRVLGAVARAGYLAGAALPARVHRRRQLAWPRVGIFSGDSPVRFRAKASPWRRRLIDTPIGDALLDVERAVRRDGSQELAARSS